MGAVAKQALARYGIVIGAHINNVGEIFDRKFDPLGEEAELLMSLRQKEFAVLDDVRGAEMQALILEARERQDSIGGSIECMALNLPAGLGEPFFDSLESRLAHVLFSIPAVKGWSLVWASVSAAAPVHRLMIRCIMMEILCELKLIITAVSWVGLPMACLLYSR